MDLGLRAGARRDPAIHDCQYTDDVYPDHVGWGHTRLTDALTFGRRVEPERLMLFHHDPMHSDGYLDGFHRRASRQWEEMGGDPCARDGGGWKEMELGAPEAVAPPLPSRSVPAS